MLPYTKNEFTTNLLGELNMHLQINSEKRLILLLEYQLIPI